MNFLLITIFALTAGIAQAELLGSGTGPNSCSAPPYRARWVTHFRGCPQTSPCCNEYGYCVSQEVWQSGQYRDCNGISNGFSLPGTTIQDEQNAANNGDLSGLRLLSVPRNRQFFGGIFGGIASGVGGIINGVGSAIGGIASGVGGAVGGIASGAGNAVGGIASGVGNGIGGVAQGTGGAIGGIASGVGNGVGGVAQGTGGAIGGIASGVGNGVGGVASGTGNFVGGVAQGTGNFVGGTVNGVGNTVSNVATGGRPGGRPSRRPASNSPNYWQNRPYTVNVPYTTNVYTPATYTTTSFQAPVDQAVTSTVVDSAPRNDVVLQSVLHPNKKICKRSDGYYYC